MLQAKATKSGYFRGGKRLTFDTGKGTTKMKFMILKIQKVHLSLHVHVYKSHRKIIFFVLKR